ncbi:DUF1772 domain-containing protein [Leptospira yanagawae]|uniref:DUF1772 domain-containing protein n=2 Tax=Leptospira yanagawae TaxID=293069 RepID=A0ABY2M5I3_9LEPT|nr:DUF1772 domain-containing protein [Leptospira yanagawae]
MVCFYIKQERTIMDIVLNSFSRWIIFLAVILLGISAGASLAEEVLLVPFWESMSPTDFYKWYEEHESKLVAFYSPLQIWSAVIVLMGFVLLIVRRESNSWMMLVATICSLAVLGTFFIYFKNANTAFLAGVMDAEQFKTAMKTWSHWQWIRIALQMGAFCATIYALCSNPK